MIINCLKIALLCVLIIMPFHDTMARSFVEKVLKFTGISVTPNRVKGIAGSEYKGNLWLVKIDDSGAGEPRKITSTGNYQSPLWTPGGDKILVVKEEKSLIQLDADGIEERILHSFSITTLLLGFGKVNTDLMLILQNSKPMVFSLADKQITRLLYDDKSGSEDREMLGRIIRNINTMRDYGQVKVRVDSQRIKDASGYDEEIKEIHFLNGKQKTIIPCPENCSQPALSSDGQRLIFVD